MVPTLMSCATGRHSSARLDYKSAMDRTKSDAGHARAQRRDKSVTAITQPGGVETGPQSKSDEDHVPARRMAARFALARPATRVS